MEQLENGKDAAADGRKVSYFVAECMEFIRYGEYRENIKTAEEAAKVYEEIPPERLNAGKGIGIHIFDSEESEFPQEIQLISWDKLDMDMLDDIYDLKKYPEIVKAAKALLKFMPDLVLEDSSHRLSQEEVKKNRKCVR